MNYVESFMDLDVYKLARQLSNEIYSITKSFPREEMYSLTDQIRRSSRSIGAQIAEAWGKRTYEKHFVSKLTDADSEQLETQHWIATSNECGYLSNEITQSLMEKCKSIGRMLSTMMEKSASFCRKGRRSR